MACPSSSSYRSTKESYDSGMLLSTYTMRSLSESWPPIMMIQALICLSFAIHTSRSSFSFSLLCENSLLTTIRLEETFSSNQFLRFCQAWAASLLGKSCVTASSTAPKLTSSLHARISAAYTSWFAFWSLILLALFVELRVALSFGGLVVPSRTS